MSNTLIPIKSFLGKYYSELNYAAIQEKYAECKLDTFFEQRFSIQNNKAQMIVDPQMEGLSVIIFGNEIYISKQLYDHPSVLVSNSLEFNSPASNPKSLYNPETFSTIAYLICQNHTMFKVVGEVDEPIYVTYKTEFESFYNSVVIFDIAEGMDVEIVEEIASVSAMNGVTNYVLEPNSKLNLQTVYSNTKSAISFMNRHVIAQENSFYSHRLLGKGSSNVLDENNIVMGNNTKSEFFGIINSNGQDFHSILSVRPDNQNYTITVDYRDILQNKSNVTFYPVIIGQDQTPASSISVSNITIEELSNVQEDVNDYITDLTDIMVLNRISGSKRFYVNKAKFLKMP